MTFSGNFMPPRFGVGNTSAIKHKTEKCPTCGHDTTRQNIVADFEKRESYVVCEHCRNRLAA